MTNWYKIFYWLTVADNAKAMFITFIVIFTLISVITTICFIVGREDDMAAENDSLAERSKKWMWWSYPFMILFWTLYVFTPSKSDTLLIIAGGAVGNFVTSDSASKAIPSDITNFLHTKLQVEIAGANDEVKRSLGVQSPKEKLIDKAKELTKEQLIEYLSNDSTLKISK